MASSPRPPTSSDQNQTLHDGWPAECSYTYQVSPKSIKGLRCCGVENVPSHYFSQWLVQQIVLPYKPWWELPTVPEWPGSSRNWPTVSRVQGEAHFVPDMWKLTTGHGHGCSLMSVLYFVLYLSVTHDLTWLECNVTDYWPFFLPNWYLLFLDLWPNGSYTMF